MEIEEKKKYLKKAFWDRQISGDDLLAILEKRMETSHDVTLPKLYVRLMETFSWYKLLELVPRTQLMELVSSDNIQKIRFNTLKSRYQNVARILYSSTLSASR